MNDEKSKRPGWNDRYAGDDYVFGTEPNDFLKSVAGEIPSDANVLCLADGEGRNGVYLAQQGHQITSVDMSSVGLEKAEKLATANKVAITTIQANLAEYDLGEAQWDCVVSIFFHIPPKLQEIIYPRIIRSLKPGGLLILESYTPEQLKFGTGGPPVTELMLTLERARAAFGELAFLHAEELERDVVEGVGHTGRAAVIQLLARKSETP
ncbi:MAG: SAM-dependent methyltransferase [Candidatus Azotimanducaceae bacterium]|jgi:SAM-dependent methyltransferase